MPVDDATYHQPIVPTRSADEALENAGGARSERAIRHPVVVANRVRPYEPEDRDDVLNLARRLGTDVAPWRDKDAVDAAIRHSVMGVLDEDPRPDGATLVLDSDGLIVGFLTIRMVEHFSGATQASIDDLVVDETTEGRGFAAALVAAAESWARRSGADALIVETGASNERALRAYRRAGFVDEDIRLGKPLHS